MKRKEFIHKHLYYERDGYIARIVFNRPEKMNAWALDTWRDLMEAITEVENDDGVKVVILKGKGPCFSSGGDMSEVRPGEQMGERTGQRIRLKIDRDEQWEWIMRVLLCRKITIVQAHGYCLGQALLLAEKCDLLIGAEDCKFGYVEERFGTGGLSMSPMLVHRVGLTKALELQTTGKMIDGKEAARIQLINRAVSPDQLESEVEELAQAICLYSRDGIAIAKAARHSLYDILGITGWLTTAFWSTTLSGNMNWEPDEMNFFKERKEKGVRAAWFFPMVHSYDS